MRKHHSAPTSEAMATMNTTELLDVFKNMTVLELNDFLKAFEEEFGVTAAAPVAVAAAPAAGGGGGGTAGGGAGFDGAAGISGAGTGLVQALVVNIPLAHSGLENGPLEIWTGGSALKRWGSLPSPVRCKVISLFINKVSRCASPPLLPKKHRISICYSSGIFRSCIAMRSMTGYGRGESDRGGVSLDHDVPRDRVHVRDRVLGPIRGGGGFAVFLLQIRAKFCYSCGR